jgi:threonine/homoserine/homoserine lactone efflux protein
MAPLTPKPTPPMLTTAQILAFLLTAVLLTATPGPDNLMVLSVGMSRGRRMGIAFGLGCALGCLSHTLLAVIGVGALIAASPTAFLVLKWSGGAYLVWLGIQALRHAGAVRVAGDDKAASESLRRTFAKGLVANAINPKVVLFFLSFLPQFVDMSRGHTEWQLGQLGLLFTAQAAVLFGLLGYFSGSVGGWINRKPQVGVWLDRLAGTVFVGLGVRMMVRRASVGSCVTGAAGRRAHSGGWVPLRQGGPWRQTLALPRA